MGLPDSVSVIPSQVRDFAQQIEEQMEETDDEGLREELASLLSSLRESIGKFEDMTNPAEIDGTLYRKLYRQLPLRFEDFQTAGGLCRVFFAPATHASVAYYSEGDYTARS